MVSPKEILQHDNVELKLPLYKDEGIKISFVSKTQDQNEFKCPEYESDKPTLPFPVSKVWKANVLAGRTLCPNRDGCKPVYELTLDVEGSDLANTFNPGDTIGIIPRNESKDVDSLLHRLGLSDQADCPYVLENVEVQAKPRIPKHIPYKSTLHHTFTHFVELRAVVKKLFLLALSKFTSNAEEKRCLEVLCSKEGSAAYNNYILENNVCLMDVLRLLPSCSPPITCILSHLPRLLPRPYSIVNSRLRDDKIIKICFSVFNSAHSKKGLTTAWLENIATYSEKTDTDTNCTDIELSLKNLVLSENYHCKVPIYLRKNMGFSFPIEQETPVLMIGPGTGVAPYIGFLEERMIIREQKPNVKLGETWLFYGCRNPEVDYVYKKELNIFLDKKILNRISTSFSRIENNGIKYVQDAIETYGTDVAQFIANGASVYVCGDVSAMAKSVQEALCLCLERHSGRTAEEAANFIKTMQNNKKYFVDVWS